MSFLSGVGDFLFGSDPGKKSLKALEKFGLTGGLGDQNQGELLNSIIGGRPSEARMASGQRLARAGLTGSGVAEDTLGNVDLQSADEFRQARLGLIRQRLAALGITAEQPRKPGFIEAAVPVATAIASRGGSGAPKALK